MNKVSQWLPTLVLLTQPGRLSVVFSIDAIWGEALHRCFAVRIFNKRLVDQYGRAHMP